jgi:hypothetical protein
MLDHTVFTSTSLNASGTGIAATLRDIVRVDGVAWEILRFLLKNESAMDSPKGIAAWWVHRDEIAVQPSLHRLFACGAVVAHTLSSGTTLYALTPDPDLRVLLRKALECPDDQPASTTLVAT